MKGWMKWLILAALILLVAWFVRAHLPDLRAAGRLLVDARPWPLAAALLFQLLYYVCAAVVVRQCLRLVDFDAPFGWTLHATFLLIFVSRTVPGPAAAGPAAMYYLLEKRGLSKTRAAMVGPLFFAVDYGVFFLLLAVGLAATFLRGGAVEFSAVVPLLLCVFAVAGLLAWLVARPSRLERLLSGATRTLNRAAAALRLPWRIPSSAALSAVRSVTDMRHRLRAHPGIGVSLAASGAAMLLCDVACMASCFLAFDVWVGIGPAFLGFCLATAGALISVLPGGLGTFDAAMVAGFTSLGAPRPAALAATLAYRVLATWIPALLGVFAFRIVLGAARRRGTV